MLSDSLKFANNGRENNGRYVETLLIDAWENLDDGFALYDKNDRLVYCNKAYRHFFAPLEKRIVPGIRFPELCGMEWDCGLVPATGQSRESWIMNRLRIHRSGDGLLERQMGQNQWLSVIERNTADGGVVALVRDITEQKAADEKLRRSERMFRDAYQSLDEGIVVYDENDKLVSCNNTFRGMFAGAADILDSAPTFAEWVQTCVERGLLQNTIGREDEYTEERIKQHKVCGQPTEHRLKNGRWVQVTEYKTESGGKSSLWIDITDRKCAEEGLRAREERLRGIMQNTADGIATIDEQGRIETFNPSAELMFGYTEREVVGRNITLLMPEPHASGHDRYIENYLATGVGSVLGVGPREVRAQRKDGSTFPMELSIGEMTNGKRIFIGSMRDISDRKDLEDQLHQARKMEAVGRLTGGIAHDFNNILMVVMGNVELSMERFEDDPKGKRFLASALDAARRGSTLTHRLLSFSRKQALQAVATDTNRLIGEFSELLRGTIGGNIEIETDLADDPWPVMIDRNQLENALLNLAVNARDAMPDGGKLTIKTGNVDLASEDAGAFGEATPGRYVMIEIRDTGVGMPEIVLQRAIEPFFTTKEVGEGTGLGLSMVYGFVKQSGGHITLDSEPDHGTTVKLYLPKAEHAAAGPGQTAEDPALDDLPRGEETILLVEDNPDVRSLVARTLQSLGYRVLDAEHGPAARAMLPTIAHLDLLLTDVVLPLGMNGFDVAADVQRRFPGIERLFMSGHPSNAVVQNGEFNRDIEFLAKPFVKKELAYAVRNALDRGPQ